MYLGVDARKNSSVLHRRLALAGIIGPLIFTLVPIVLASFQTNYNPFRDTLSALALKSHGWIQTLDFCIFGFLVMLFSLGLYTGIMHKRGLILSLASMFLIGLGFLLVGIFPTDTTANVTWRRVVHKDIVYSLGLLFPVSCFLMLPSLKADPRWKSFTVFTGISGIAVFFL